MKIDFFLEKCVDTSKALRKVKDGFKKLRTLLLLARTNWDCKITSSYVFSKTVCRQRIGAGWNWNPTMPPKIFNASSLLWTFDGHKSHLAYGAIYHTHHNICSACNMFKGLHFIPWWSSFFIDLIHCTLMKTFFRNDLELTIWNKRMEKLDRLTFQWQKSPIQVSLGRDVEIISSLWFITARQ